MNQSTTITSFYYTNIEITLNVVIIDDNDLLSDVALVTLNQMIVKTIWIQFMNSSMV